SARGRPSLHVYSSCIARGCKCFCDPSGTQLASVPARRRNHCLKRSVTGSKPMRTVLLVILILLLLGALPTWPYSSGWGYYPSGGLGLILLIVIILVLVRRV